ncbi:hypothetical protein JTB14_029936 [Gonioctena quinquepunctata]|nr:hypothetical protein JTB14_029936 [Gonioctena quinquepunctata]
MAMAKPVLDVSPKHPCKRCQKVALSGYKCIKCETISHSGCLRQMKNIKYVNREILCCGTPVNDDLEESFDSAKDLTGRSQTVNKQIEYNECTNLPRQITSKHISEGITLAIKGTQEDTDNPATLSNETWETQARKSRNNGMVKNNKPIVGNKTKCSLKAATQKTFVHVYKLDVTMKPQDVSDFLKPSFPEVEVEQLLSTLDI